MNTPKHATDEQIDALWKLLQLEAARNFVQAYTQLAEESGSFYIGSETFEEKEGSK